MRLILVVVAFCGLCSALLAQGSLRERVRKEGDIGTVILHHYYGAEMTDLVRDSDLIAQVMVQGETVRLSKDETKVLTDYSAQVFTVLHQNRLGVQLGSVITMTKNGGTLLLEGRKVHAWERDFPPLELGAEYVVFLKKDASGSFSFSYGAQSVFTVESGMVNQLARSHGAWKQQRGDKPAALESFVEEVQKSVLALQK